MTGSDENDFTQGALTYMKRAAPERAAALQKIFDDHGIRVSHTSSNKFEPGQVVDPSPTTVMGIILYPPIMHTLAWLLIHGGWEAMRNYGAAIISLQLVGASFSGSDIEGILARFPDTKRCAEAIKCAVDSVRGVETPLPSWLPNINDTNPDVDINRQYYAVRELWFIAQCWFLYHELQHILFGIKQKKFSDLPQEELACDSKAIAWVLAGAEFYSNQKSEPAGKVRGKRAMGILVGLFCIGWLSARDGSDSHPPLKERVRILLEQVGTQDTAQFWNFAVGLLFVLSKDQKVIQISAQSTIRDIALQIANSI
jgi:hypothetical protein